MGPGMGPQQGPKPAPKVEAPKPAPAPAPKAPAGPAPGPAVGESNSALADNLKGFDSSISDVAKPVGKANSAIGKATEMFSDGPNNLSRASKVGGAALGVLAAPGQVGNLMDGELNSKDASSALGLAKTGLDVTQAAGQVSDYRTTKAAAQAAFKEAAPGASKSMLSGTSKAAADHALAVKSQQSALKSAGQGNTVFNKMAEKSANTKLGNLGKGADAVKDAAKGVAGNSTLAKSMGTGSRAAAKAATGPAAKAAAAAAKATAGTSKLAKAGSIAGKIAKGSGQIAGKAGARFVPGLNAAVAAMDTANAVSTLRDPKASTTSKVTSVITAAGSIAAATNIPIVSQVGGAVSAVSSFIGSIWG